ncbi:hypothetical protein BT96DRAFT_914052 [Gymnopus androsaceus JB14]|uniref:Uncharacterized protein n=1 Tax=Gymnopus androsaceus JB14 TaxID=1447944 RepID=A0A6A4IIY1_9AGAR|nr:hypothetical protein BT96DRAFT_914052 [Gymnopus androsaceus JB14]
MDRLDFCDNPNLPIPIIGNILYLTQNRRLFRIALLIPMILGIAGINETSSNPDSSTGTTLRKASTIVFLVLTIIQVLQTVVLIKAEREGVFTYIPPHSHLILGSRWRHIEKHSSSFGATHASILYGIISLLLLIREIFTVATLSNISEANNEHLWYPLVALPEFLCVIIFAIPGVIPSREAQEEKGIPMYQRGTVPAR